MLLTIGALVLLLGLLAGLLGAHVRELRYFDRPAPARNAWFDPAVRWLGRILVAAGLGLTARASIGAAVVIAAILALLWACRRLLRSEFLQRRLLRAEFDRLKRERPDRDDAAILYDLAWRRHARWGPELIEAMVKDYPAIDDFARIVARMERGFRGFQSGGRRPRGDRPGRPGDQGSSGTI